MMQHRGLWILALALLAFPLAAQQPPACRGASIGLAGNQLFAAGQQPPDLFLPVAPQEMTSVCTASCGQMGGTASVSCPGACTAVDQNCENGQQGYAQCLPTGQTQWCNPCVECSAQTSCPDGTVLECSGYTRVCQGAPLCYVWCGGYHIFCPGHEGEELCEN
jgi:hypothetical protein